MADENEGTGILAIKEGRDMFGTETKLALQKRKGRQRFPNKSFEPLINKLKSKAMEKKQKDRREGGSPKDNRK